MSTEKDDRSSDLRRQRRPLKKTLGKLALYIQEGVWLHRDVDRALLLCKSFFSARQERLGKTGASCALGCVRGFRYTAQCKAEWLPKKRSPYGHTPPARQNVKSLSVLITHRAERHTWLGLRFFGGIRRTLSTLNSPQNLYYMGLRRYFAFAARKKVPLLVFFQFFLGRSPIRIRVRIRTLTTTLLFFLLFLLFLLLLCKNHQNTAKLPNFGREKGHPKAPLSGHSAIPNLPTARLHCPQVPRAIRGSASQSAAPQCGSHQGHQTRPSNATRCCNPEQLPAACHA